MRFLQRAGQQRAVDPVFRRKIEGGGPLGEVGQPVDMGKHRNDRRREARSSEYRENEVRGRGGLGFRSG
jgi:hypothetical protein